MRMKVGCKHSRFGLHERRNLRISSSVSIPKDDWDGRLVVGLSGEDAEGVCRMGVSNLGIEQYHALKVYPSFACDLGHVFWRAAWTLADGHRSCWPLGHLYPLPCLRCARVLHTCQQNWTALPWTELTIFLDIFLQGRPGPLRGTTFSELYFGMVNSELWW